MLNVLNVAKSGYYAWLKRPKSKRQLENEALEVSIEAVYKESRENSGSLRLGSSRNQSQSSSHCSDHEVSRVEREK
jgi:putative transposase